MYLLVFIIGWVAEQELVFLPWELVAAIFGIIVFSFVIASLLLLNRFQTRYTLDSDGVLTESGKKNESGTVCLPSLESWLSFLVAQDYLVRR
jgi:hypothetical protein